MVNSPLRRPYFLGGWGGIGGVPLGWHDFGWLVGLQVLESFCWWDVLRSCFGQLLGILDGFHRYKGDTTYRNKHRDLKFNHTTIRQLPVTHKISFVASLYQPKDLSLYFQRCVVKLKSSNSILWHQDVLTVFLVCLFVCLFACLFVLKLLCRELLSVSLLVLPVFCPTGFK